MCDSEEEDLLFLQCCTAYEIELKKIKIKKTKKLRL